MKKWIGALIIIFVIVIITILTVNINSSNQYSKIMLENIEAYAEQESGGGLERCTEAGGYCFIGSIKYWGITIKFD